MGMAEEIVTQPNYEKLCSNILNCNEHVRFAGLCQKCHSSNVDVTLEDGSPVCEKCAKK